MHRQPHPDPELLDRLRAGLLDDEPAEKATLEEHLAACENCRAQQSVWTQIASASRPPQLATGQVRMDLRRAREYALASQPAGRHGHGFLPYATAALLLIAVSLGLWNHQLDPDNGLQQTATVAQSVPDIYEDLDFYLWLANQEEDSNEDGNGNPNST